MVGGAPECNQKRFQRADAFTTIDAQVHAYERNHSGRPWMGAAIGRQEATGQQLVAAMDAAGVHGSILVSPFSTYRYDASYAVQVQAKHPDRFGIVKPVDPEAPSIAEVISEWKSQPGAVGVRLILSGHVLAGIVKPGVERTLAAAAKQQMPVNLMCWGDLDQAASLAARHPDTQIVVDHLGIRQPWAPPAPEQPWAELPKVLALAAHPNVAIKITGACTLSHDGFPYRDIWDPLFRIFDAFGLERCLWGTDWTRAIALLSYEQGVDCFRKAGRLSERDRAMLMGGAAARIYDWSPNVDAPLSELPC